MSGEILVVSHGWRASATGNQWVEAKDSAIHPPMHRTAPPPTKVNSEGAVRLSVVLQ